MRPEMTEKEICDLLDKDCQPQAPATAPLVLRCYARQAYGQLRIYCEESAWIRDLLGQTTILQRQIQALQAIGIKFSLERNRDVPKELAQLFDEQH